MGKNMYINHVDDELEDFNPSCLWGIVHAIDYHHWRHNVKRMLPYRKNQGRHAKSHGSPKARPLGHASGEMQMLLHEEERTFPVNQSNKESVSINKRSLKARFKALIADQTHKEGNYKHHGSRFSTRSRFERTHSIHHLEPPDGFGEICTDWEHPIIFFPNNEDTGGTKLQDPTKMNATEKPDTDDGIRKLSSAFPASKAKSRLTKSGSFPVGDLSHRGNLGPSKLKHKQSEIWTAPRGEKVPVGALMSVSLDVLKYSKNLLSRSGPSADNSSSTKLGRALSLILLSTDELDKGGHRDFLTPLQESKQAVQFEGMKGKNEANSCPLVLNEVSNRQDSSTTAKDFAESSAETTINRDGDKSSSKSHERDDIDYRNSTFSQRRSSSLNESLGKYALLLESSFGKEVKLYSSKSLRLSNDNEMRSGKSAPVLFSRIRSLSQLDEFYSSLENLAKDDANFADWPITSAEETGSCTKGDIQSELKPTCFSTSTEQHVAPDYNQEPQHQNEILERSDCIQPISNTAELGENITGECSARMDEFYEYLTVGKSNSYRDQETNNSEITYSKFAEPVPSSASDDFSQDEASSFREMLSAEGSESRCNHVDEDSSINWQNSIDRASSSLLGSMPNLENIDIPDQMKALKKNKPDKKDGTDLDYVTDLLELSGFTKDAFQRTWHSLDQPLNPSVFEEMEAYWHQELECSKEDLWSCYHHQLLFELVNEELARLFDRSSTYYPKALSSSCHIRPFPIGNHLLEEICSSIISSMSLKPEQMQSLDSIVDLNLRKNDGWMNLQMESECLALELEDMIFGELLEELIYF